MEVDSEHIIDLYSRRAPHRKAQSMPSVVHPPRKSSKVTGTGSPVVQAFHLRNPSSEPFSSSRNKLYFEQSSEKHSSDYADHAAGPGTMSYPPPDYTSRPSTAKSIKPTTSTIPPADSMPAEPSYTSAKMAGGPPTTTMLPPAVPAMAPPMGPPPGPPGGFLSKKMSRPREIAFNIMVCFLQLIPQACLTTCFPISRIIANTFHITDISLLPWLIAAYASSFGTLILVSGRLGDIFGHKQMVIIGFSWMSFWSVVAGLSHYSRYEVFFLARGLQGVGASLMVPNGLALLGRTYAPGSKQKIFAFTLFGLCAPVGAYMGMLTGALFGEFVGWWWSFYTLAIASAILAIAASFVFVAPPKTPKQLKPFFQRLADMDWIGAVTGVSGLLCLQIALVCAPVLGWKMQWIFMLLIIGVILIIFFIIIELRVAAEPLVPFKMLKAEVAFVLTAVGCGWATFGVWTWYLWRFLLSLRHDSPLTAAIHVLPIVPVALIASVLTAWMMRTMKPAWTLFWALVAFTLGPVFLVLAPVNSTYWSFIFISLLVMPFGMDMSFPAATMIMSNFFPPHQQGVAGSLISTVVNYSISFGLGLASTVEVYVNHDGTDVLGGLRGGWYMGIGLGGLGVTVCAAFVLKTILEPKKAPSASPRLNLGPELNSLPSPARFNEKQSKPNATSANISTGTSPQCPTYLSVTVPNEKQSESRSPSMAASDTYTYSSYSSLEDSHQPPLLSKPAPAPQSSPRIGINPALRSPTIGTTQSTQSHEVIPQPPVAYKNRGSFDSLYDEF